MIFSGTRSLFARHGPGVNAPRPGRRPLAADGGAGTFDGVFITGIIAVLLASLL